MLRKNERVARAIIRVYPCADALMQSADRCFQIGIVCADYTESLRLRRAAQGAAGRGGA